MCVRVTAALVFIGLAIVSGSAQTTVTKPGAAGVAREFYRWYLQSLAHDRDPLTQDRSALRKFIDARLLAEIDRKANGPDGLEADYFIQAQDYEDDWVDHIVVSEAEIHGATAVVTVTLASEGVGNRLRVELVKNGESWMIRRVSAVGVRERTTRPGRGGP